MLRARRLFCIAGFLLTLFSAAGFALAGTQPRANLAAAGPSAEPYVRLAMSADEARRLRQEAANQEAANALAVRGFRFPKRDCRLPPMPTDNETWKMKRKDLSAVADKIKDFGRCVGQAKVFAYEAVKDLVVIRLGGTVQESGNRITFSVTPNVSKDVARLFNQVNESYISGFTRYEVANQKYNHSAQIWNSSQKFKAEFGLKNSAAGASADNR